MKTVAISVGILVLGIIIWVATRKPLSIDEELGKLPADERQALESLAAAIGGAAQLRAVSPGVLSYNPKAVAVQDGHVVELRIADAGLVRLDPVASLTRLRTLFIDGSKVESLRPLSGHNALKTLNLSRCQLTTIAELRDLPALVSLDLSGNQVTDVASLVDLPALEKLTLTGNPLASLPPNAPSRWVVKSDAQAADSARKTEPPMEQPDHWVEKEKMPAGSGKSSVGRVAGVVTNARWEVKGEVASLSGAVVIDRIPGDSGINGMDAALEVEVESGTVRGYIEKPLRVPGSAIRRRLGYAFCEASPGKPGKIAGTLASAGPGGYGVAQSYHIVLESVGGEAKGIKFRLLPPSR